MRCIATSGSWFPAAILTVVTLLISTGCGTLGVIAEPQPPGEPRTELAPLDVGLYLNNAFKGHEGAGKKWDGPKFHYPNLGEASAVQFQRHLDRAFRTVKIVDERPPFTASRDSALHAIIEPAIEKSEFKYPATNYGTYTATIHYRLTVYDMAGRVMLARSVEGFGTHSYSDVGGNLRRVITMQQAPIGEFVDVVRPPNPLAVAASKAIEDGALNALNALLESEEFKTLLDTRAQPGRASAVMQMAEWPSAPIATAGNATTGIESQLQHLDDLRARGIISEEEHATLRKRVIEKALTTPERPAPATRPPEPSRQSAKPVTKQIKHISDLAGTWIGPATTPGNPTVLLTLTLRNDSSYEALTPSTRFAGNYWITGGKARYRSTTTGRTGTFELREHDGQRLLIIIIDGGGGGELRPASK